MYHTVLWNVYIHDSLFSGHVIITDAVAVGIRSYHVSPINVLDTFIPRPSLATHTVIGSVTTTHRSGTRSLLITFRSIGGIWLRTARPRKTGGGVVVC